MLPLESKRRRAGRTERHEYLDDREAILGKLKEIIDLRLNKKKAMKGMSELFTIRAGHPVKVIYFKGLDRDLKLGNYPFVRTYETDCSVSTIAVIMVSDGIFQNQKIMLRMLIGMTNRWNRLGGLLIGKT